MPPLRMATARTATLTIGGSPSLTATQNSAYAGFTPTTSGGSGGNTFSMVGTALPAGLSLNSSTGAVTGSPTSYGTISGIVQRVTDSYGHTADLSWGDLVVSSSVNDGSSTAKSGAAQFPTLLDLSSGTNLNGKTFSTRPSQNVPGVDYRTGPSATATYYDISSSTDRTAHFPAGWNWDGTNHIIEITGPGTLDGWNLDIGSPTTTIQNAYSGSGTVTITNNSWKSYANLPFIQDMWNCAHTGLMEVGWNKLDLNGNSSDCIRRGYMGGYVMQNYIHHNEILNGAEDGIVITGPFTDLRIWANSFYKFGTTSGAHADMVLQIFIPSTSTGATTLTGLVIEDNLIYQPGPDGSNLPCVANSMVRCGGNATALTLTSPRINRNTIVGIGYTSHLGAGGTDYPAMGTVLQGFGDATDSKTGDLICTGTYLYTDAAPGKAWNTGNTGGNGVDFQGCYNTPWQMIHSNNAPYLTTANISGNYDMRTGGTLTAVSR